MSLVTLIDCEVTVNFISYALVIKYHLNLKAISVSVIMRVKEQLLMKPDLKEYH